MPTLSDSPSSASSAAPALQEAAPLPAAPDAGLTAGGAEIAAAVPQIVPVDTDAGAWLPLCRPLSQHFESCYLTAYPDPASDLGNALQTRGLWYKVLGGAHATHHWRHERLAGQA